MGLFTVAKKDGTQRLVGDARAANRLHRRAPYAPLVGPGAVANIDLTEPYVTGAGEEARPVGIGADLQD
eukprot:6791523-Lingulodinium_polyedra.AAC.1